MTRVFLPPLQLCALAAPVEPTPRVLITPVLSPEHVVRAQAAATSTGAVGAKFLSELIQPF